MGQAGISVRATWTVARDEREHYGESVRARAYLTGAVVDRGRGSAVVVRPWR